MLENDSGGPTSVRVNITTRNVTGSGNGEARYMRLMLPNKQRPIDLTINGQEVDFPFTNGFVEFMVLTGQHNFKLAF